MRETMLVLHFLGLAMGIGTSFAFMFLGRSAAKMAPEDAFKFMTSSFGLARMGQIGLTILVITGLYLITPFWSELLSHPTLIIKLCLVLLLGALIGIMSSNMNKVKAGDKSAMKKIQKLGPIAMLTGITIVIMAVVTFR